MSLFLPRPKLAVVPDPPKPLRKAPALQDGPVEIAKDPPTDGFWITVRTLNGGEAVVLVARETLLTLVDVAREELEEP